MEVVDRSQFYVDGRNGDFTLNTIIEQDVSQIKKDNWLEAQNSNGFTDGRTMRKTASISMVEYLSALKLGYGLDLEDPKLLQAELHRYLRERGQEMGSQTVKHILTPGGNPNIIIR